MRRGPEILGGTNPLHATERTRGGRPAGRSLPLVDLSQTGEGITFGEQGIGQAVDPIQLIAQMRQLQRLGRDQRHRR